MDTQQAAAIHAFRDVYLPEVSALRARNLSRRIAMLLDARMLELGVSQVTLAGMVGVAQATVSRHVRTGTGIPVDTLDLYCQALELDIAEVVATAAHT